jgi:hypothetical protein
MGFLNLLRVPESVDRDSGGLPELALVRSLRPNSIAKHTMNSRNPTQRKISNRRNWLKFLQPRRRAHDPMLVFNMSLFNFEPASTPLKARENVWA